MHKIKLALLIINLFIGHTAVFTQQIKYETIPNIPYYTNSINQTDNYKNERCKLDLYYPTNMKNFPVVVWFHGGGLTGGEKEIPEALKKKNLLLLV